MTTVYEAINLAADHIERNPKLFRFNANRVPECDTPGCAIGWVAHFRGHKVTGKFADDNVHGSACVAALGVNFYDFYDRMRALMTGGPWCDSAAICAATLRKYAEKYHGHEQTLSIFAEIEAASASLKATLRENRKRDLIPAGVREIFSHTYTAKDLTV